MKTLSALFVVLGCLAASGCGGNSRNDAAQAPKEIKTENPNSGPSGPPDLSHLKDRK